MANVSVVLFESITHSGVTTPRTSNTEKGIGYYGRSNGLHTVQYSFANGFVGVIEMQGTLTAVPTETDWSVITEASYTTLTPITGAFTFNFAGNFTWVRAVIREFTAGDVNRLLYTHN